MRDDMYIVHAHKLVRKVKRDLESITLLMKQKIKNAPVGNVRSGG